MSNISVYSKVMGESVNMALANCTASGCNVRIVSYFFEESAPEVLYFTTFAGNDKCSEFAKNNRAAFTTIPPAEDVRHVRSRSAAVKKSSRKLDELLELILSKMPGHVAADPQLRQSLELYEIHVASANVVLSYDEDMGIIFKA